MPGELTTHVLDVASGRPAGGITIELRRITGPESTLLTTTTTNADGRTDTPLLTGEALHPGIYELTFHIGRYFQPATCFYDQVPIRFQIQDASAHYHVPLLCSPWSYSTYRGS